MQKGERFRFVAVVGLVVALMSAGFALAGDSLRPLRNEPSACEPIDDTLEDGGTVDEGDQGESQECEDEAGETDDTDGAEAPADDEAAGVDGEVALEPTEERVKECTEVAGMTPADAPEEKPDPGEKKGLENAIAHVLWNCLRNDNDGLVNALEHLSDNLERKGLPDEAKEERKADREAAKADREAAKADREAAKAERKAAHEAAKLAREAARAG
jgi:hypothetical protein